jgi:DNA phosphorothioation-dependent restriction protein DptH
MLLWFAPGSAQSGRGPCVIDRYGQIVLNGTRIWEMFIDPSTLPGLWWSNTTPTTDDLKVRNLVNQVIGSAFAACGTARFNAAAIGDAFTQMLGLSAGGDGLTPTGPVAPPQRAETHPPSASEAVSPAQPADSTPAIGARDLGQPATPPSGGPAPTPAPIEPRVVVGWQEVASRWTIVGKMMATGEPVALDLDHPKTIGIFGYMGSGKSYLLGNLIESAVQPLPGINALPAPLAVVVFNYRRNAADRFELASLAHPNVNPADAETLAREYGAVPSAVGNLHVLCLPGELRPDRQREYGTLGATELFFDPRSLGAEDWELLMGEPGSEAVFARTIRNTLVDLRSAGDITLAQLEQHVTARLSGQSRTAARLRFDFVRRYLSQERGIDFGLLVEAGRVLIVDLRQPLFNKDDALRFFLVCANQISKVEGRFNKMLVFDEAHEYMSDAFGERMEARIRLMRHEGTSYIFATQDVASIPMGINRFLATRFVFDLGTRENVLDLEQAAPEFRGYALQNIKPGFCLLQANLSTGGIFTHPREIRVRPRVTQHGGGTRIFSVQHPGQ